MDSQLVNVAVAADAGNNFAVPSIASTTAPSTATSALEMLLALVVVLGVIFALAWLLRRLRSLPSAGRNVLRREAELVVGDKERVVVLAVGEQRWLIGVAPGRVSVLHSFGEQAVATQPPAEPARDNIAATPSFAQQLRRSLGMSS